MTFIYMESNKERLPVVEGMLISAGCPPHDDLSDYSRFDHLIIFLDTEELTFSYGCATYSVNNAERVKINPSDVSEVILLLQLGIDKETIIGLVKEISNG